MRKYREEFRSKNHIQLWSYTWQGLEEHIPFTMLSKVNYSLLSILLCCILSGCHQIFAILKICKVVNNHKKGERLFIGFQKVESDN